MYSVTAMIDQLNWQKLEHRRDTSRLCLLFKILHHQATYDIPASAPITSTTSSHERNLSVPYTRTDVQIVILPTHSFTNWSTYELNTAQNS